MRRRSPAVHSFLARLHCSLGSISSDHHPGTTCQFSLITLARSGARGARPFAYKEHRVFPAYLASLLAFSSAVFSVLSHTSVQRHDRYCYCFSISGITGVFLIL
ncbi:hypothetical protein GQ55_3G301500 [Panicum hallii var. hallii]|uniref:Uncharacterized protein n=1 Tax=Panicum hallii var. hallii TaxID=1504633 RepID=A0A2T7EEW0_9POAL|nr:hypothetical protein GQ55_3G301500 [Panicum hallii var. hallii]